MNKKSIGIIFICLLLFGCQNISIKDPHKGIFSWGTETVLEDLESFENLLVEHDINRVYQQFSKKLEDKEIQNYTQKLMDANVDIYALVGEADWGLDITSEKLVSEIRWIDDINKRSNTGIKGIMVDVEPYLMDTWEKDKQAIMESYVAAMEVAYQEAKKFDLTFILCVPYFYDTVSMADQVEILIQNSCDEIAIMNYNKHDEIKQIDSEVKYADSENKKITIIYEMQAPGNHSLTENNTYYKQGISGVKDSFSQILKEYKDSNIDFAIHDYRAIKEKQNE